MTTSELRQYLDPATFGRDTTGRDKAGELDTTKMRTPQPDTTTITGLDLPSPHSLDTLAPCGVSRLALQDPTHDQNLRYCCMIRCFRLSWSTVVAVGCEDLIL